MKKIILTTMIVIGFMACTNPTTENTATQKNTNMKNLISIVESPTDDFSRAVTFYETILDIKIEEVDMDGTQMGVIPADEQTVNVVLVKGSDYKPTTDGAVLYLNAGNDLQPTLDKIETSGGKIIVPKTEINAEMGFFALFIDSEGNKLGLHSSH
jgi:predicted enzyme related to lactoylglutathione lyase